jgi:ras-related protein rab-32
LSYVDFFNSLLKQIGIDFALKVINWDDNCVVRLQLWDIAGQERFGNMTRVYYKEAVGAFVVFDVSQFKTFEATLKWKLDLDSKVLLPDGSKVPCLLLANKVSSKNKSYQH